MQATVILAFYNDLPRLQLVLGALQAQYTGQFEVVIADDGSKPEVVQALKHLKVNYQFDVSYLWHADNGFRKTIILNQAVMSAKNEWLIFVDADCVPQTHFVDDHLRQAKRGICLTGRRIDLPADCVDAIDCSAPEQIFYRNWARLLAWSFQRKARNIEKGVRLPPLLANRLSGRPWGVIGCNFSVHRDDLIAINGFDERHSVAWGAEDSDLERRLRRAGLDVRGLRYQATMVHLDASYSKRQQEGLTRDQLGLFEQVKAENRTWTPHGIIKEDRSDPILYAS
jgi:glycosyltransferase involved in cell wall biosynthesis